MRYTVGVSNLALDTTGVGDSQQVQVSGYVLPGLQVKYGVGIFDSLATLTLRYRLMPKLYLEAVSGLDQALERVTGLADEPKVEVFSDPAMSQQEALSYLLRGQGLNSDGDSNALTSALVGLGVAQSGQVVGKIGET
ncbi:hypothetical protein CRX72_05820 [Pantoea sp. BRM17]|nr:hypothetical protein CRX72_05820 [Pantoea sp. BRM17]